MDEQHFQNIPLSPPTEMFSYPGQGLALFPSVINWPVSTAVARDS